MTRLEFKRISFRFQHCHYMQEDLQINLLLQLRLYLNFLVLRSEALHQLCRQTSKSEVQIPSFAIKNERSCSFFLILDTYSDTVKYFWLHTYLFQTEIIGIKVCREISRKKVDLVPVHMSQSLSKFAFCWVFTAGVLFEGFDSLVGLSLCNMAKRILSSIDKHPQK